MNKQLHLNLLFYLLGFFFISSNIYSQKKVISSGDDWQYFDKERTAPIGWETSDKYTKNWKKGISPLGYGDSAAKTTIGFGYNPEKKHITNYFKKTFRIDNPYQYLVYSLNILRDDGAVVYLNGREVMRSNMPTGKITPSTLANSLVVTAAAESYFHKKLLLPDDFIAGVNTISVSIHKARNTSIDCIFDLELIGTNDPKMLPNITKERALKNLSFEAKLKDINYKQEIKNKDLKYQLLSQSQNSIKTLLYGISILFIISLITLFYLWRFFSNQIQKSKKELTELINSNQNKDREMMNISLDSLNNGQYLKELKKELELNLKNDLSSSRTKLKKIISQIDYNLGANDEWENLKKHFNAVHSGFYDKLFALHPSLSEIELRHCIFIKLFMQTKEIATILHIEPKSVQASRYRIKKKMELGEGISLRDYLLNL